MQSYACDVLDRVLHTPRNGALSYENMCGLVITRTEVEFNCDNVFNRKEMRSHLGGHHITYIECTVILGGVVLFYIT